MKVVGVDRIAASPLHMGRSTEAGPSPSGHEKRGRGGKQP